MLAVAGAQAWAGLPHPSRLMPCDPSPSHPVAALEPDLLSRPALSPLCSMQSFQISCHQTPPHLNSRHRCHVMRREGVCMPPGNPLPVASVAHACYPATGYPSTHGQ